MDRITDRIVKSIRTDHAADPPSPHALPVPAPDPDRVVAMREAIDRAVAAIDAAVFAGDGIVAGLADVGCSAAVTAAGNYGLIVAELEDAKEKLGRCRGAFAADYREARRGAGR